MGSGVLFLGMWRYVHAVAAYFFGKNSWVATVVRCWAQAWISTEGEQNFCQDPWSLILWPVVALA
jgi:hypothetical protein